MKKVYLLTERYKDNDPSVVGCYGSIRTMVERFAEYVSGCAQREGNAKFSDVAKRVAVAVSGLLGHEWAQDEDGECSFGSSLFSWTELDVENGDGDADKDERDGNMD